jgi:hypothetical protein
MDFGAQLDRAAGAPQFATFGIEQAVGRSA